MDRYIDKTTLPKLDKDITTSDLKFFLNPCVTCLRSPFHGDDCLETCRLMELWEIFVSRCNKNWIPIKSKLLNKNILPKQDKRVLVQLDNGWQQVGYHDGQEWQLLCDEYIQIEDEEGFRKVVAWMELPELYKEKV